MAPGLQLLEIYSPEELLLVASVAELLLEGNQLLLFGPFLLSLCTPVRSALLLHSLFQALLSEQEIRKTGKVQRQLPGQLQVPDPPLPSSWLGQQAALCVSLDLLSLSAAFQLHFQGFTESF